MHTELALSTCPAEEKVCQTAFLKETLCELVPYRYLAAIATKEYPATAASEFAPSRRADGRPCGSSEAPTGHPEAAAPPWWTREPATRGQSRVRRAESEDLVTFQQ